MCYFHNGPSMYLNLCSPRAWPDDIIFLYQSNTSNPTLVAIVIATRVGFELLKAYISSKVKDTGLGDKIFSNKLHTSITSQYFKVDYRIYYHVQRQHYTLRNWKKFLLNYTPLFGIYRMGVTQSIWRRIEFSNIC